MFLVVFVMRILLLALPDRWHRRSAPGLTAQGLEQVVLDIRLVGAPRSLSLLHGHIDSQFLYQKC